MQRPDINKPSLEEWHNDDEQLANLIDHIDKKVLNVSTWEFRISHLDKYVKYGEVLKNLNEKYPNLDWTEALKDSFKYLPDRFRIIKGDLFSVFKRFTLNLQERLNYIQAMEEYATFIEEELTNSREKVESLKQYEGQKEIREELIEINKLISSIINKDIEKPKKPPKQEEMKEEPEEKPIDDKFKK